MTAPSRRDLADGAGLPAGEHAVQRLDDGDLAGRGGERAHGRDALLAVGEADRHDAGAVGEHGERLRLAEEVVERPRRSRAEAGNAACTAPALSTSRSVRPRASAPAGNSLHELVEQGCATAA